LTFIGFGSPSDASEPPAVAQRQRTTRRAASSPLVPADELSGLQHVSLERALELPAPGTRLKLELDVERMQTEEVAVGSVTGWRAGT
jgi:hypothetical protein